MSTVGGRSSRAAAGSFEALRSLGALLHLRLPHRDNVDDTQRETYALKYTTNTYTGTHTHTQLESTSVLLVIACGVSLKGRLEIHSFRCRFSNNNLETS